MSPNGPVSNDPLQNTKNIVPIDRVDAVVVLPGSKSITNRALLLAAFGHETVTLKGALDCEDTRLMLDALAQLGLVVQHGPLADCMTVQGVGGIFPHKKLEIYVGNSGTTARFLTAALCFTGGTYRLFGKPRMHCRPISDLVDALDQLGASIQCENGNGCPPVLIQSEKRPTRCEERQRRAIVRGNMSSQFLSALLMAAPRASETGPVEIRQADVPVSRPYIDMTVRMIEQFGVSVNISEDRLSFCFKKQSVYRSPNIYPIEPDASAASYFFAAAAVCGGRVTVPGLSASSLQGDVRFVDCLEKMGCDVRYAQNKITVSRDPTVPLQGISVDMNAISDTAQTLAAVALFAEGPTTITNIEHVRYKETDRIAALATELRRFGADVYEHRDGLTIIPPARLVPATVETYDDHRMAMSMAVVGLRLPGVAIRNPDCVQKTFPTFFDVLESLLSRVSCLI